MRRRLLLATGIWLVSLTALAQRTKAIDLHVNLMDAPRHLLHVTETFPAHAGLNTYSYPQWIPSQELPGGPIDNLTGIVFHAGSLSGPVVPWRRDLVDSYAFHVRAPAGVTSLAVSYDILDVPSRANTVGSNHSSSHVEMLEMSEVILYPSHVAARDIPVTATVHLPASWRAATALRTAATDAPSLNGPDTTFRTVSLEQLVDSPILAGDHCRQYPLAPEVRPVHTLDVCADTAADLNLQPALLADMNALVRQATRLFVGHHYAHYDFLVADSPHLQGDSMEHGQSADYVVSSLDLSEPTQARFIGYLLPHEFVHSWCGKYRRPLGVATADYATPMQNDLLWVYEGLTEYYGDVLSARAGFHTPMQTLSVFDQAAYDLDQPGRRWRTVQDTADASAILRGSDPAWSSWRLSQDYYHAGTLLWLEADVKMRQLSRGTRSLDDFAARFFSPVVPGSASRDTNPGVLPYTFAAVVAAMNQTEPYDWKRFWQMRLNALTPGALTAGLSAAGYDYVDVDTMVADEAAYMQAKHMAEMFHSLGFLVMPDGTLEDVWMNSPAFAAGLGPGDKLTAVNGRPYSADTLIEAVREAKTGAAPIRLTAVRDDEPATYEVQYHGGERYAGLARNSNPDLLTRAILQPR